MIPTVLVLGFGAGLITGRLGALFIPLVALAWSAGLGEADMSEAAFLAAANAALGVGVGCTLHLAAKRLFRVA